MRISSHHQKRWDFLQANFKDILGKFLPYHSNALYAMLGDVSSVPNILLYGVYGLPLDLMWKDGLRRRLNIDRLPDAAGCTWNKEVHYMETPYYIHVDLENPYTTADIDRLQEFLKTIITTRSILCERHTIVLENIDSILCNATSRNAFRVLLERFSKNVWFVCTTYHVSRLEPPLISRFCSIRCPLPTEDQVVAITEYIDNSCKVQDCRRLAGTRNLVRAISIEPYDLEGIEGMEWIAHLTFPPVGDYILGTKEPTVEGIRAVIYKAYQCGVSLPELASDILDSCCRRGDNDATIGRIARELGKCEHMAVQSKGMRTLLYMEYMLHYVMVIVPQIKKKDPK